MAGEYDYVVDELLGVSAPTKAAPVKSGEYDYLVDELLSGGMPKEQPKAFAEPNSPLPLGKSESGAVSTITNKPIMQSDPESPQPVDFGTMVKAEMVKDPATKQRIYAESRGVPIDRYSTDGSGEIVFRDDQGKLRYEEKPVDGVDSIKRLGANIVGNPQIPLSTVGAAFGGAPGAITGAMAGETVRQSIAGLILDDPQTAKGNLIDLGVEGLVGALAEFGGKGVMGAVNKALGIGKPEGRLLASAAKRDFPHIDSAEVKRVKQLGDDFGIDLFPAQTTKSKQLIAKMNLLRDLPQTSDIIQAADVVQNEQIQGAIPRFLDRIAPAGATSRDVGEQVKVSAELAIKGLKDDRAALAKPIYEAAFKENSQVDISEALSFLDDKIANAQGRKLSALTALRGDIAAKIEVSPILDSKGRKIITNDGAKSELIKLHGVKTDLDKRISSANKPGSESYDNILTGEMKQIRSRISEAMDSASPTYKLANETFAFMTPAVKRAEAGLTGVLAQAKEKDLVGVTSVLLASGKTRPETVAAVKAELLKQPNGEAVWNGAVRDYLEFTFERIKDSSVSGITNIGGNFRKSVFGNVQQRKILQEALGPQQYSALSDFMTVLERTGLTFKAESTTALRQSALQDMKDEFGSKTVTAVTQPLQAPKRLLGDKINEVLFARGAEKLAKAMISDDAAQQLLKLKKMPKGSEELIKGLTQFIEMTGIEEVKDEVQ